MRFAAAVFDLDDTLYDYKSLDPIAIRNVCNRIREVKQDVSYEHIQGILQKVRNIINKRLPDTAAGHNRILYFQMLLEELGCYSSSLCLELYEIYWGMVLDKMVLRQGVIDFLDLLHYHGIRIAVCTDLTANIQHRKIVKLGLDQSIDVLVSSEEVGKEKPDQAMFLLCLEKLKLEASQCFFVGDSFNRDVMGAQNIGMFPVYFSSLPQKADVSKRPGEYLRIENFSELSRWFIETNY